MSLAVAILAGGLATRLGDLTRKVPKSLLPVAGEPFIRHQLRLLRRNGVDKVVVCAGHLGEQIEAEVGDGGPFGLAVRYSHDGPEPLGTGGALRRALPLLGGRFMVLYGDSFLDIDYQAVARAFLASGCGAMMTVYRNEGRYGAGNAVYADGRVLLYEKKRRDPEMLWIDYGLGCLEAAVLGAWPEERFDLAELYAALSRSGRLAGYEVLDRFYEIGSPQGLAELNEMFAG